jgi:hypothetical protein
MSGNFVAKLTGPDGLVDRKLFGHRADAIRYVQGEGLENFEGDVEKAEVFSPSGDLIWHKRHAKIEDQREIQIRTDPDALYWRNGKPRPKPKPDIEAYCDTCQQNTMNRREYERLYGIFSLKTKPLLRCSECCKVRPDNAPRP